MKGTEMRSEPVKPPGYFPPGLPEYGGLRHMILVYSQKPNDWPAEDFRYSVTHLDSRGNPEVRRLYNDIYLFVKGEYRI